MTGSRRIDADRRELARTRDVGAAPEASPTQLGLDIGGIVRRPLGGSTVRAIADGWAHASPVDGLAATGSGPRAGRRGAASVSSTDAVTADRVVARLGAIGWHRHDERPARTPARPG